MIVIVDWLSGPPSTSTYEDIERVRYIEAGRPAGRSIPPSPDLVLEEDMLYLNPAVVRAIRVKKNGEGWNAVPAEVAQAQRALADKRELRMWDAPLLQS